MTGVCDVVVIGGGHNALIAAGYLAQAGLEVTVLEANQAAGGNTITEELLLPGWQHDSCSSAHALIQGNPVIRDDELELLSTYGLKYAYTEPAAVLPLGRGASKRGASEPDCLVLHRSVEQTADELGRFSAKDARRLTEMIHEWNSGLRRAHGRWNAGMPAGDDDAGRAYERLRRRSAYDVVVSNFESGQARRLLLWMGFASFHPPTRPGTGVLPVSITNGRLEHGWATPIGGSGALPAALVRQITDHGGTVQVNAHVDTILIEHERATGARTTDGRTFRARKAVVSSAHLAALPAMFGEHDCPPDIAGAAARWRPGIPLFALHAALRDEVEYVLADGRRIRSTSGGLGSPEGTLRQVRGCQSGEPEMDDPWLLMVSSTVVDPGRAPGATFKILTAAPGTLAGGSQGRSWGRTWEAWGESYGQRLLDLAGQQVEGLSGDNVLAVRCETPASLAERNPGNLGGSCHGGEFLLPDGAFASGWPSHATSVEGLFLTGSTTHPGGSVSGWPGRNAAFRVLASLGIKTGVTR